MGYVKQPITEKFNSDTGVFKPNFFISFLFFVYMFMSYYEPFLNQIIGAVTKYLILFIIFVLILVYKKPEFRSYHFILLGWLILKLISVLWSSGSGIDVVQKHFISQFGMVAFFIVMTLEKFDKKIIENLLFWLYLFSFSIGFLALFLSDAYLGISVRQTLHLFGNTLDPNNQSALCLSGVAIGIYYVLTKSKFKLFHVFVIAVNITSMLMTASRGGLISLTAVVLLLLFVPINMQIDPRETVFKVIILIALAAIFFLFAEKILPENIYNRLFDFSSYAGGSDRVEKWNEAFRIILDKPLFGAGWGGNDIYSHNTYITMLMDIGIVGTGIFFIPIGIICFKAGKQKNLLPILLILVGFAPSFFIDAINKRFFWNAIVLAAVVVNSYVEQETDNKLRVPENTMKSKYIK
ncbi:MAG: O-antigen ligase family protein [Clostridia bacterium]|nr:O-antigen ligase family protein [Clostridia bacterium]